MIFVITPAFLEDHNIIERNILSVQNQICDYKIFHYVFFDGVKKKKFFFKKFSQFNNLYIFQLRKNHNDFGDYIRRIATRIAPVKIGLKYFFSIT